MSNYLTHVLLFIIRHLSDTFSLRIYRYRITLFYSKDGSLNTSNVKLCHVVVYVKYWFTFFGRKLVHEISENNWCEQKMKFNNKNPFSDLFFIHLRKFPMHFYSLQQSNLSGYFLLWCQIYRWGCCVLHVPLRYELLIW